MKKLTASILSATLMLSMVFSSSVFAANDATTKASAWDSFVGLFTKATATTETANVQYRGHVQDYGDVPTNGTWVQEDNQLGTTGESKRIEGFKIELTDGNTLPAGTQIRYNVHVENEGWLHDKNDIVNTGSWEKDGAFAGSVAKSQRVEAIEIVLTDANGVKLEGYSVQYMVHGEDYGWSQGWVADGAIAGTEGQSKRLEAIRIKITQVKADLTAYNAALAAVTQADYTTASWTTYQGVVNANKVTADNTQTQVNTATANITAAQGNLVVIPKVTSVTAINATQVVVTFNTVLDEIDAETLARYTLDATNASAAVLGTDEKTVTLTYAGLVEGTDQVFNVNPIETKADSSVQTEKYTQILTYKDTVKPEVLTVKSATNGAYASSVTVKASEPIVTGTVTAKIDGDYVAINFAGTDEAIITGLSLDATVAHTIEIINLTDLATIPNVTVYTTKTFNITNDVLAPTVTLSAKTDKDILLTFSKSMDVASVEAAFAADTGVFSEILTGVSTVAVSGSVANTEDKQFIITVDEQLFETKTTRTLSVVLPDTIQDELGNAMAATTKTVVLTKDTVKPTATGYKLIKNTDGEVTSIEVNFSEALSAASGTPTIVNSNGVDVTGDLLGGLTIAGFTAGDKKVTYDAGTDAKVSGTYAFSFAKDLFIDDSLALNKNVAFNLNVDFGTDAGTFELPSTDLPAATANVVTVTFGKAVKGGAVANSATDLANYTLSGKALPVGTTITLDDTQNIATITLPDQSIAKTDATAVFSVANVKALDGSTLVSYAGTIGVLDNTDPTLTATTLNTDGTITVKFSEDLEVAPIAADLVLTINGKVLDENVGPYDIAPILAGADAGNYLVTVTALLDPQAGNTATQFSYIDVNDDGAYTSADIKLVTGTTAVAGPVNLKNTPGVSTIKLATLATGASTAEDFEDNTLVNDVVKTVK